MIPPKDWFRQQWRPSALRPQWQSAKKANAISSSWGAAQLPLRWRFLLFCSFQFFPKGLPGFFQYYVEIEVEIDREKLDPTGDLSLQSLYDGDARGVIRSALYAAVDAEGRIKQTRCRQADLAGAEQTAAQTGL